MSETVSPALIRCGVAGVGYLGQHHARIYSKMPGAVLAGIFEPNRERAHEIASKYGCPVFETLEALADACDAISIVVPTDRHRDVALPLLARGKHLLIEKPICTTLDEAREILSAASKSGSLVQVGHIEHFNPVMKWLEKEVHQPRLIIADRLAPYQPRGTEVGVTLDLMIHDIGIVLALARSKVVSVEATGMRVMSATEDIASARITFESGCVANLTTSRVSHEKMRRIQVFQPSALLTMDFMNQEGWLVKKVGNTLQREHVPLVKDEPLRAELESFLDSVRKASAPQISGEFGRDALGIALQVSSQIRRTFGGENLAPVTQIVTAASANRRVTSRTFLRPPESGKVDLLVIAGEHSGDQHAAAAVRKLLRRQPDARICALGGPALREAGAQLLLDMTLTSVVGLAEVLRHFGHFHRIYTKTIDWIATYQPKAVCFVDYPGLNLRIASALKRKGISVKGGGNVRTLYYISPQVWAWKAKRRFLMADVLDQLGVIFPFEVDVFSDTSLKPDFLGHPFAQDGYANPVAYAPDAPVLILPGSRNATIDRNLPVMLETFERLRKDLPSVRGAIIFPDEMRRARIAGHLAQHPSLTGAIELRPHTVTTTGAAVLVSSGTISLQCALAGIPGALAYKTSPITYFAAKRFVKLQHIGMPNLLHPEPVYREYIQGEATPEALSADLREALTVPARRSRMQAAAKALHDSLAPAPTQDPAAWLAKALDLS